MLPFPIYPHYLLFLLIWCLYNVKKGLLAGSNFPINFWPHQSILPFLFSFNFIKYLLFHWILRLFLLTCHLSYLGLLLFGDLHFIFILMLLTLIFIVRFLNLFIFQHFLIFIYLFQRHLFHNCLHKFLWKVRLRLFFFHFFLLALLLIIILRILILIVLFVFLSFFLSIISLVIHILLILLILLFFIIVS